MEKPYDLKVLGEKLKARGLDVAEESLKGVFEDTLDWVGESAKLSPTPIDDLAVGIVMPLKAHVLAAIDKLDRKQG